MSPQAPDSPAPKTGQPRIDKPSLGIIATMTREGFKSEIHHSVNDGIEMVEFLGDADIDADGANGQNGARAAYRADDRGTEALANGGMGIRGGRVVFIESWGKDIAITTDEGMPLVLSNGNIPTKTAYRFPDRGTKDPEAYVDAETVPYIVVPPIVCQRAHGVVLGCMAEARNMRTGQSVECVVADIGPRTKTGEVSMAAARALGIPSSPRNGGTNDPIVRYRLWPGRHGYIGDKRLALQRFGGGGYIA